MDHRPGSSPLTVSIIVIRLLSSCWQAGKKESTILTVKNPTRCNSVL